MKKIQTRNLGIFQDSPLMLMKFSRHRIPHAMSNNSMSKEWISTVRWILASLSLLWGVIYSAWLSATRRGTIVPILASLAAMKKPKWITHPPRTESQPPLCIFSSVTYTMVIRPVRPPGWPLIITPARVKRRHVAEVVPWPREWQRGQVSLSQVKHTGEPGTLVPTCLLHAFAARREMCGLLPRLSRSEKPVRANSCKLLEPAPYLSGNYWRI